MPGLETGLVMRLLTGISGKTAGMVAERVALTDSCRPCLYPPLCRCPCAFVRHSPRLCASERLFPAGPPIVPVNDVHVVHLDGSMQGIWLRVKTTVQYGKYDLLRNLLAPELPESVEPESAMRALVPRPCCAGDKKSPADEPDRAAGDSVWMCCSCSLCA